MATLRVAINAAGARAGAAQANQAFAQVQRGAAKTGAAVRGADASIAAMGKTAAIVKSQMVALFGAFVALRTVQGTVNTLREFGETMQFVRSVSIDTTLSLADQEEQFRRLSDAARGLGATTRFTATQAAEGLLALGRAGFSTDEALDAIRSTLNLATAGMLELGEASDLVAVTIRQFGLQASEAERVADVFLTTSNKANTTVEQLGQAMKFAGVLASQLGVDLEETAGAMAILADAGLRGTMSGTALRTIMLGLQDPTSKAKRTLEELGLTTDDVSVQQNGLIGAFKNIVAAGADVNDFTNLFVKRSLAAALALSGSIDKAGEFGKLLDTVGGSAQRAADIINDSLNGDILALKSAFESVQLSMTGFNDSLREIVQFITLVLRALDDIDDSTQGVTKSAKAVASALQGMVAAFKALIALKFIVFVSKLRVSLLALNVVVRANPFGVIALAIGAVISALKFYEDEMVTVGGQQVRFGDVVAAVWAKIKEFALAAIDFIATGWKKLFKFLADILTDFPGTVEAVVKGIANFFKKAFASIGLNWTALWQTALKIFTTVANAIIATFESIIAVFTGVIRRIQAFAATFAKIDFSGPEALAQSLANIGIEFVNLLNPANLVKDAIDGFSESFAADPAGQFLDDIIESLGSALDVMGGFLDTLGISLTQFIGDTWEDIVKSIGEAAAKLRDLRQQQERARPQDILEAVTGVPSGALPALPTLKKGVSGNLVLQTEFEKQLQTLRDLRDELGRTADEQERFTAVQAISALAAKAFGEDTDEARRAVEKFLALFDEVQALREFKAFAEEIGDAFSDATGQMLDGFVAATRESENAADAFKKFGEVAVQALEDFIRALIKAVIQQALLKPLSEAISGGILGLFSADGNVFQGGRQMQTFASGGVITSPAFFPMANGGVGLAGEAGPEGILPLRRGADGKLGVIAQGGGGGTVVNQTFNISTPDADSFRKSQRQIAEGARRQLGRTT